MVTDGCWSRDSFWIVDNDVFFSGRFTGPAAAGCGPLEQLGTVGRGRGVVRPVVEATDQGPADLLAAGYLRRCPDLVAAQFAGRGRVALLGRRSAFGCHPGRRLLSDDGRRLEPCRAARHLVLQTGPGRPSGHAHHRSCVRVIRLAIESRFEQGIQIPSERVPL